MNRPTMVRQTNEHELLPTDLRNRWYSVRTQQERRILLEDIEKYKTTQSTIQSTIQSTLHPLRSDDFRDLWKPPSPGLPAPLLL